MGTRTLSAGLLLAAMACGSAPEEDFAVPVPVGARLAAAQTAAEDAVAGEGALSREVFVYSGGTRDPFVSLLDQASVGPELPDLNLVAVYVDHGNTARNVAVLRERVTNRRYSLHEGDRIGRLQVLAIREREVTFLIDDFGVERRETLALRKSQEDMTP